jgi:hypothetical protein
METLQNADEYAVYSRVLNDRCRARKSGEFVIAGAASPLNFERYIARVTSEWSELLAETISDLKVKDNQPLLFEEKFSLELPVVLITQQELEGIFKGNLGGGWARFHELHPLARGIIRLSRIGFNVSRNQALVCVGEQSGGRAGIGTIYLLSLSNDGWHTQRTLRAWIS